MADWTCTPLRTKIKLQIGRFVYTNNYLNNYSFCFFDSRYEIRIWKHRSKFRPLVEFIRWPRHDFRRR